MAHYFTKWMSAIAGAPYRLPSSAELACSQEGGLTLEAADGDFTRERHAAIPAAVQDVGNIMTRCWVQEDTERAYGTHFAPLRIARTIGDKLHPHDPNLDPYFAAVRRL
jgi:hypothetical protein